MQNFNIDIYAQTINNLKKQINELQSDAEKAEKELSAKLQKVAQGPKEQDILEPYIKKLENNIKNIDLTVKQKNILKKLGGEFDYELFNDQVEDIVSDFKNVVKEYELEASQFDVEVPVFNITEKDKQMLNYKAPSILDEIKERLGMNMRQYEKYMKEKEKQRLQQYNVSNGGANFAKNIRNQKSEEFQEFSQETQGYQQLYQKQQDVRNNKNMPKTLLGVQSQPQEPAKEIKFQKTNLKPFNLDEHKSVFGNNYVEEKQQQKQDRLNQQRLNFAEFQSRKQEQEENKYIQISIDQETMKNQKKQYIAADKKPEKKMEVEEEDQGGVYINYSKNDKIQIKPLDKLRKEEQEQKEKILKEQQEKIEQFLLDQQQKQQKGQQLDRETIKEVLLEVLKEREQIQNQQIQFNQSNVRQQKQQNINSPSHLQDNYSQNESTVSKKQNEQKSQNQQFQNQQQSQQQQQQGEGQMATGFLNLINNTFAQLNSAINNRPIDQINENNENENFQQQQEQQQQQNQMRQDFVRTGQFSQQQQLQYPQFSQFQPYQQQFQQQFPMQFYQQPPQFMSQFQYPQPMVMPQIPQNFMNQYSQGNNQNQIQGQQKNQVTLDLDGYFKEFQLSDGGDSYINKSDISQFENQNNKSYAESIFNNNNESNINYSRSEGQVSIPDYYKKQEGDASYYKPEQSQDMDESQYTGNSQNISEGEVKF
ncbi:hypothetical protein PPERSA_09162 [Pseudocohnilembus persalinus]|uniref:Uncharacterized protein n=1 Tax=Pseudocohnilembus persalinus TaxID=266149 RepID=A0A0V0QXY0_PSEPJ|nr:hypothetical protein PPERSA_09162 [Pseudocohnilembus persalinus]|eukprot:KRX06760.1 hypothetical protein PPERSA_09162 [Pseudocohnilembus persalinus]